jgi:hypothetical protein
MNENTTPSADGLAWAQRLVRFNTVSDQSNLALIEASPITCAACGAAAPDTRCRGPQGQPVCDAAVASLAA